MTAPKDLEELANLLNRMAQDAHRCASEESDADNQDGANIWLGKSDGYSRAARMVRELEGRGDGKA